MGANTSTKQRPFSNNRGGTIATVLFVAAIIVGIAVLFNSVLDVIGRGAQTTREAYQAAKEEETEKTYQEYYDTSRQRAEEAYHTSNDVTITIGEIRETAELEVLSVSDTIVLYEEIKADAGWFQATGTGVYTVNLQVGEYLIDNERRQIIARVPKPTLNHVRIDEPLEELKLENNRLVGNGSIQAGDDLHNKARLSAARQIEQELRMDQDAYIRAKSAAQSFIESMIRQINSDVDDLIVEVMFME